MPTEAATRPNLDQFPPSVEKINLWLNEYINQPQWDFMTATEKELLMEGGWGGGKTVPLVLKGALLCYANPGVRGFLGRDTYPNLKDTLIKTLEEWMPPEWGEYVPSHGPGGTYHFNNGSEILCRHFDKLSEDDIRSLNLSWAGIDQVEKSPYGSYMALFGRLRQGILERNQIWATANPHPGWVKRHFLPQLSEQDRLDQWSKETAKVQERVSDPEEREKAVISRRVIHFTTQDNAENLPPDYIATMRAVYGDPWYRRYVLGDWSAFEGLVYPDFSRDEHVIEPFEIPPSWVLACILDYGHNNPTHVTWFATDFDDNHYIIGEYRENGLGPREYSEHQIEEFIGRFSYLWPADPAHFAVNPSAWGPTYSGMFKAGMYCDPSLGARTAKDRPTFQEAFAAHGLHFALANNQFDGARTLITEWLRARVSDGMGTHPKLRVFNTCPYTIGEFESWMWEENKNPDEKNDRERPKDKDNHAMDTLTYFANLHPEARRQRVPVNILDELQVRVPVDVHRSQAIKHKQAREAYKKRMARKARGR